MKFQIKDDADELFTVEKEEKEVATEKASDACDKTESVKDADDFTADEKKLMKKLLKHADELLAMLDDADEVEDENEDAGSEIGAEFEEAETDVETKESVVDSDELEEKKFCDSKNSFGSIEKKTKVCDSEIDTDEEISKIWSKRYGG